MKDKTKDRVTGDKFYYVVKDTGKTVCSYRHGTVEGAYAEACRLALKENKPFYVMATVAKIVPEVVISKVLDVRKMRGRETEMMDNKKYSREFHEKLRGLTGYYGKAIVDILLGEIERLQNENRMYQKIFDIQKAVIDSRDEVEDK